MRHMKKVLSGFALIVFATSLFLSFVDKTFANVLTTRDSRSLGVQLPKPIEIERIVPQIPRLPPDWMNCIEVYSSQYGLPSWVVARLINRESQGERYAFNDNGTSYDMGPAQLNSKSLPGFEADYNEGRHIDPYDVDTSIRIACAYLSEMYVCTGTLRGAVMAYNCGLRPYLRGSSPASTVLHANVIFRGISKEQLIAWNVDKVEDEK